MEMALLVGFAEREEFGTAKVGEMYGKHERSVMRKELRVGVERSIVTFLLLMLDTQASIAPLGG